MVDEVLPLAVKQTVAEAFLRDTVTAEQAVRAQTVHARPMPVTGHNIAFALSEMAGEVIDAIMRGYPEYVRNNGKTVDLELEIGDTFSQIASALVTLDAEPAVVEVDTTQYLAAKATERLAYAQVMWQFGNRTWTQTFLHEATEWLLALCQHLGVAPEQALRRSHEKTLRKHGG
jgi:NTP pyrophosphatase (non-canonical NTP hydrolase)